RLDLSGVNYLSSAGIGTLVEAYKEFKTIQGSFAVVHPSPQVRTLLTMTKLDALLIAGASPAAPAPTAPLVRQLERSGVTYELFDLAPAESLRCAAVGNPALLEGCRFRAEHCQAVRFPASSFAVGLGAFGTISRIAVGASANSCRSPVLRLICRRMEQACPITCSPRQPSFRNCRSSIAQKRRAGLRTWPVSKRTKRSVR